MDNQRFHDAKLCLESHFNKNLTSHFTNIWRRCEHSFYIVIPSVGSILETRPRSMQPSLLEIDNNCACKEPTDTSVLVIDL